MIDGGQIIMQVTNKVEAAFLILTFLFSVGSIVGWVIELLFRRFISNKNPERKWINPGFLIGPYLPLYGFGLITLFVMSLLPYVGQDINDNITLTRAILTILAMGLMMTLIELIAGLIFIKGLKVKLWDYSDEPCNFMGIISLRFSIIWTILAAVYYFFIQPSVKILVEWFGANIAFTFIVGVFFGIFIIDLGYSLNIVGKIREFAVDNDIVVKYEALKSEIRVDTDKIKKSWRFMLPLNSEGSLLDTLKEKKDAIRDKGKVKTKEKKET